MRAFESRLRKIETAQHVGRGTAPERMSDAQLSQIIYADFARLERTEGPTWAAGVRSTWFDNLEGDGPAYDRQVEIASELLDDLLAEYAALKAARSGL